MTHVDREDWIAIKYNIFHGFVNQFKTIAAIVLGLAFQDLARQFYTDGAEPAISAPSFVIAVALGMFFLVISAVVDGYIAACKRLELQVASSARD